MTVVGVVVVDGGSVIVALAADGTFVSAVAFLAVVFGVVAAVESI
jgi:hypothetical protein